VTGWRRLLEEGIAELQIHATDAQIEALGELARLVDRWGTRINLTGHRGLTTIVRRLVLDAVALLAQLPELESLADLGSGAGFPGLPAAILRPSCRVTLVEARERRHHFQRATCRALGLANATLLRGRAEDLEASPHAGVIAQAVGPPSEVLPWMIRWAEVGALLILPGGREAPEVANSRVRLERIARYRVPCGGPERTLWLGRLTQSVFHVERKGS
jgi:16S rRNA (guanine527-N7)-methyltransferase